MLELDEDEEELDDEELDEEELDEEELEEELAGVVVSKFTMPMLLPPLPLLAPAEWP